MSMLSAWTMGAMASKNASEPSPVADRIARPKASEVSGPRGDDPAPVLRQFARISPGRS